MLVLLGHQAMKAHSETLWLWLQDKRLTLGLYSNWACSLSPWDKCIFPPPQLSIEKEGLLIYGKINKRSQLLEGEKGQRIWKLTVNRHEHETGGSHWKITSLATSPVKPWFFVFWPKLESITHTFPQSTLYYSISFTVSCNTASLTGLRVPWGQ